MDAKNYTNIAGSPFQPYVREQIEQRKKIVSEENRTYKELQWLTNKNVWIRISSGTDVDKDNNHFPNETGDTLSKKYILQAGLTDYSNNSFNLREGLGDNGAYGIGVTQGFGFKPMPGLENISIKTGGKLGTLREATIEFTCYNLEQLNIMDALYMKLGFNVLIEWGHIPFINNKGELDTNPKPLDFYKINSKEELMVAIQENRVYHAGNYDAMWGTVKNFSYSFGENGEFKCKIDLVGAGDILESLKINQSGNIIGASTETLTSGSDYPVVADANKSLLNEALYNYFNLAKDNPNNPCIFKGVLTNYFKKLNINFEDFSQNSDLIKKGFHYSLINRSNTIKGNGSEDINIPDISDYNLYFSNYKLDIAVDSGEESINKSEVQVYITLGHLLLLTLATGGIYDKKNSKENPYIYIDVNPETNRCYTFPGHCSLDPTVCLIGSQGLPLKIDSKPFKDIQKYYPFYDATNPKFGGRFMWTLVNVDFVAKTLRKYASNDPKGNVNFVDFMQDILSSISKACGGFNEFRIVPDDDTRCIRIFDDRGIPGYNYETSKYTEIPVLGKNSLAYDFSYTSKISPQMATQTVVAAQAQDKGIQGSKDALAFSHLNKGLTNRLSPTRVESVTELNGDNTFNETLSKYIELRDHLISIYSGVSYAIIMSDEALDAVEKNYGVTINKDGTKNVPKDKLKSLLIDYLQNVYDTLKSEALKRIERGELKEERNNIKIKVLEDGIEKEKPINGEIAILTEALGNAQADLAKETSFDGAFMSTKDDGKTYVTNENYLYEYVHKLLEKKYSDLIGFRRKDTPIEAVWTDIAKKQTKVTGETWY